MSFCLLIVLQGAFGKGALVGFGLTTYTLLGLGVVCLLSTPCLVLLSKAQWYCQFEVNFMLHQEGPC